MKIKPDKKNYRKHPDKNKELIKKSLSELGAGRSILIDSENEIIAGNGVFEQAEKLKIPVKVVETDGSELVVVKRTDLKPDDKKRKELALADNSTSDTSEFDFDKLENEFTESELEDFGVVVYGKPNIEGTFANIDIKSNNFKYPITFIANEDEYFQWTKIKNELGIEDDTKALFHIFKNKIKC